MGTLLEAHMSKTRIDFDQLQALDRPSLLARWTDIYGEPPPIPLYGQRLIRGITHRQQVMADPALQRVEQVVQKRLRQADPSPHQPNPAARICRRSRAKRFTTLGAPRTARGTVARTTRW